MAFAVIVLLFIAAFFAFAPEDRIHSFNHWRKLKANDPVAHCIEFHKKDFLAPESIRFVEGSIEDDVNDDFFEMRVSGLTRGGGRSQTYVTCIGKYATQKLYTYNEEFERAKEYNQVIRNLREENARIERDLERRAKNY